MFCSKGIRANVRVAHWGVLREFGVSLLLFERFLSLLSCSRASATCERKWRGESEESRSLVGFASAASPNMFRVACGLGCSLSPQYIWAARRGGRVRALRSACVGAGGSGGAGRAAAHVVVLLVR